MLKSGAITGAIAFVLAIGGSFLSAIICVPCWGLFAGLGAGYLGGLFDKPTSNGNAAKAGAGAGAIGGVGGFIGQIIGSLLNAAVVGPEASAEMLRQLGVTGADGSNVAAYYAGAFGTGCCLGLGAIALMAGLGALGGILWWQLSGKNSAATPPAMPGAMA
jgi:hypothetical protein